MTTTPEPTTADYRTVPPEIAPGPTAWQAWWEDFDSWDGYLLYADLDVAKHHSAVAYVGEEYSWIAGDDPADEAPDVTLTWEFEHQRWHLLDDGRNTGVQLYVSRTYAAPAVLPPVSRAAAERVVAYRSPGTRALYCVTCARQESGWKPATAEVQDDTVCDFCGECVLAVAAPAVSLPVSRAAVLREAAEVADGLMPTKDASWYDSLEDAWNEGTWAVAAELRRMVAEEQPAAEATPCSEPDPCKDGELCDVHETEQAHAEGDHGYCGITCEAEFTSEKLRNGILWRAAPGSAAMLDELLRRATPAPTAAPAGTEETRRG